MPDRKAVKDRADGWLDELLVGERAVEQQAGHRRHEEKCRVGGAGQRDERRKGQPPHCSLPAPPARGPGDTVARRINSSAAAPPGWTASAAAASRRAPAVSP